MRLTKLKKSKIELEPYKQQNKTLISNYQKISKEPSNTIFKEIIQNNSSFNDLKETIKKESNSNIKEIFSSDESRLKAIKYVIQNQKNEQHKLRQNLSYISYDMPISYNQKNKTKEKIKNSLYKKIEKISPIKTTVHKSKFIKNETDLLNSPMNIIFQRSRINSNNVISQSEVNIQYLKNKTGRNKNTLSENKISLKPNEDNLFYRKVQYVRKNDNKRDRNNAINCNYNQDNEKKDEKIRNRTINNFYVHKQINKSGVLENDNKTCNNNIKKYKNNNQGINVFYSTKNINYDIMYNFQENDSHNNQKNISKDEYYNFPDYQNYTNNKTFFNKKAKKKMHNSLYIPEVENESDTCPGENNFEKINYISNANKMRLGQKRRKPIIRVIDTSHNINNYENSNYYQEKPTLSPINLTKQKDRTLNGYNNSDNLDLIINANTFNNDFSFHKKILTNFNNKRAFSNLNNSSSKNIIFKKKAIKDTNMNKNNDINKKIENEYNIYSNDSFSILSKIKNKFIFKDENDIIDFINNKFIKEKKYYFGNKINYTGYILTKKLKGKTLFEINIDDDINKFNKVLKDENIKIGNKFVEIISINDKEKIEIMKKGITNLENELEKIKKENEALNKKDFLKNELIKKLDKEKQNIIEENKKLMLDLDKLKKLNEELNTQIIQYKSKNNQLYINTNYKEENIIKINIINRRNNTKELSDKSNNNMENKTPSSNEQSNILSTNNNINNSNIEIGMESKKNNNAVSLFRLSKMSEIRKIDNNNNDSDKREIKNNIDLLNGKIKNGNNNDKINPFNNSDD